jgi:hypothetical protein
MDMIFTTIRIDHKVILLDLRDADPDITAAKIEARMREFGVNADVSDVISHIMIIGGDADGHNGLVSRITAFLATNDQ